VADQFYPNTQTFLTPSQTQGTGKPDLFNVGIVGGDCVCDPMVVRTDTLTIIHPYPILIDREKLTIYYPRTDTRPRPRQENTPTSNNLASQQIQQTNSLNRNIQQVVIAQDSSSRTALDY
jgi:hypothetical protein